MRTFMGGCLVTAAIAMISGCLLISATGEYDLHNETNVPVRVAWTDSVSGDSHVSESIAPGVTTRLASQRLLEADSVPPSHYFETFVIQADYVGGRQIAYSRPESHELFDADWEAQEIGYRRHAYVFAHPAPGSLGSAAHEGD